MVSDDVMMMTWMLGWLAAIVFGKKSHRFVMKVTFF
jgi:hypothetical protein